MSYHLSRINRLIAVDIFKEIKEGKGFAVLNTTEPDRIIYIIRAALADAQFAEWKGLITLRRKENKVIVKPSIPSLEKVTIESRIPTSSLKTFNSIASLIVTDSPAMMQFPDAILDEKELNALKTLCNNMFYSLESNPLTIKKV